MPDSSDRDSAPFSQPKASKAWVWRAALGLGLTVALGGAAAGWWHSRHAWRIPRRPEGPIVLKGCNCASVRGPVELMLTIKTAEPAKAGEATGPWHYEATWALGIGGNTVGLRRAADDTAPSSSFSPAGMKLQVAMACTDQGVLLASGDRATLWDFNGKAVASVKLPRAILGSRSIFDDEGACDVVMQTGGAIVLQGEGRSMRLVPSGMVIYVE